MSGDPPPARRSGVAASSIASLACSLAWLSSIWLTHLGRMNFNGRWIVLLLPPAADLFAYQALGRSWREKSLIWLATIAAAFAATITILFCSY